MKSLAKDTLVSIIEICKEIGISRMTFKRRVLPQDPPRIMLGGGRMRIPRERFLTWYYKTFAKGDWSTGR